MIKITIQAGTNTYLVASKTIGVDGVGIFQGRLLNEVVLSRRFSKAGNAPVTLNVSIKNNDGFIPRSVNLWAASVTIVSTSGHQWSGKITAYDRDNAGILRLVITEKAAPELTIQFPDEVARLVPVDENFHVSALNVTLPLVVGGNAEKPILVKGVLIDKVRGIYLLCVGENHQIVNVYRGTEKLTAGFSAYTGTSGQAEYAGFAYVELTDAALRKNDDGSYVEVSADVIGLKLGSYTVEECRNGARFLQYLLTTPKDGACGWGLGIGSSEIDAAAFSEAITRVDAASLKMDGVFYFRQPAQSWIDQICQAIRGSYEIGENGLRRLFVNADAASAKTYTKKNMKLLRDGKGGFTGQVYNRGRLDFDYNPLTGQFMQHVDYEDDTGSIADIGELDFSGQSYLIRDMATAQAILDYTCKRSLIGADKVYFKTRELPANARTGTIITIDYPEKALSGTWQIISIDVGSFVHEIEAEKFSSSIFVVGTPGTAIDWSGDAPVVSPVLPGAASGLSLATDVEYDANGDGSAIPYISGTFTIPEGKYLGAAVFWGEGAAPSAWNSVTIKGTEFKIKPVKAGQQYTVKVQMFNQSGSSAAITGSIVAGSHAALPPTPTIATATGLGCIVVNIAISAFAALSHFEIQRQKSDGSGLKTIASEYRGTSFTDDDAAILADYENLYQYRVRSVSRSGRTSAWTSFTTAISATQLRNKDVSADQFIGKHFTTACNVGAAQNGVMFNAQGLQAWCNGVKTVDIPINGSPTFSGTITAGAGLIGGWSIGSCYLQYGCIDGVSYRSLTLSPLEKSMYFYQGNSVSGAFLGQTLTGAGVFSGRYGLNVVSNGNVIFEASHDTNHNLTAQLAGWQFGSWYLHANNGLPYNSGLTNITLAKTTVAGDSAFSPMAASGGSLQGLHITSYSACVYPAVGWRLGIGAIGAGHFYEACATGEYGFEAVCSYDNAGTWVTDALLRVAMNPATGAYRASIAGWNFNPTQIYSSNCGLILCSSGTIQTGTFVTGNYGWRIGNTGNAEFNNICARGAIRTAVFIKDQISVVGGCTLILPAAVTCVPNYAYSDYSFVFESTDQFNIGDIIRAKDTAGNDWWGTVHYKNDHAVNATFNSGVYGWYHYPGQTVVNYGPANSGGIMLNGQAPYIDLYTHDGTPWNGTCSRVRIGNLDGWGLDFCTGDYGWVAGCPTGQRAFYTPRTGLCVVGNISSCSGDIGGWTFIDVEIRKCGAFGGLALNSSCNSIYAHRINPTFGEWHGQIYENGWTGRYGFAITRGAGNYIFRADTDIDGNNAVAQIAGWGFDTEQIIKATSTGLLTIRSGYSSGGIISPYIWAGNHNGNHHVTLGGAHFNGSYWIDQRYGIQVVAGGWPIFTAFAACDGSASCFNIAGWQFGSWYLHANNGLPYGCGLTNITLAKTTVAGDSSFSPMAASGGSLQGLHITSYSACAYPAVGWRLGIGAIGAGHFYDACATGEYGFEAVCSYAPSVWVTDTLFRIAMNPTTGAYRASIAGWNFNTTCLYSGNLIINSSGAITGNYSGDTSGWCIDAAGNAKFNNATVRGTVCASAGRIGCFDITGGVLVASMATPVDTAMCQCSVWCSTIYTTTIRPSSLYLCSVSGSPTTRTVHLSTDGLIGYVCNASSYLFSCFQLDTMSDGSAAAYAPFKIRTYGGDSCFAFCTNGRIQVQGTVYPSDRNLKTDFEIVSVLPMLRNSPVMKWRYKGSRDYQFGPVAQDFNPAFKLVHDWETNLTVSGLDGIALRGVQELDECVAYNNRRIIDLESRNACLETRLNCLESELMRLKLAA